MSTIVKVLGLDQSYTSTGAVVMNARKEVEWMGIVTTKKQTDDPQEIFHRARSIVQEISNIMEQHDIDFVSIEQLAYGSVGDATRNLAGLQFMIINMLIERGIPFMTVPPTSLKKYASGKGNCGKEEMFESLPVDIKGEIGKHPKSKGRYDLADAYWLASKGVDEYAV